jgi:hypothetical protein
MSRGLGKNQGRILRLIQKIESQLALDRNHSIKISYLLSRLPGRRGNAAVHYRLNPYRLFQSLQRRHLLEHSRGAVRLTEYGRKWQG